VTTAVLASSRIKGIIVDDFPVDRPASRMGLAVLADEVRRCDASLIVTSAKAPGPTVLHSIGNVSIKAAPYLTEQDVTEFVQLAGGNPKLWGRLIHTFCGFGHPQLVAARVISLMHRDWPDSELLKGLVPSAGPAKDLDDERGSTRARLIEELPDNARELLYRLAVITVDFDRELVFAAAAVEPSLPRPGELLDLLTGPWIEIRAENRYRVSPLVSDAGNKTLSEAMQGCIHRSIVDHLLTRRPFPGEYLGLLLNHSLLCKHESGLLWIAGLVLCSEANQNLIAERLFLLPLLLIDSQRPLLPQNPYVSAMLSLAQFKVACTLDPKDQRLASMIDNVIHAAHSIPEKATSEMFRFMALGTVLIERPAVVPPSKWFPLLVEFQSLLEGSSEAARLVKFMLPEETVLNDWTVDQFIFANLSTSLNKISDLDELFQQLSSCDPERRSRYLSALKKPEVGASLMVNSSWLREHERGTIDGRAAAAQFEGLAVIARKWGERDVAIELFCAQAIMLDDYAHDPAAAFEALERADKLYSGEFRFARRRANIHFRNGNYEASLKSLSLADENLTWMNPVDRAFFLREAGISAAKIERFAEAAELFERARNCAKQGGSNMLPMAVGLLADRAVIEFRIGNRAQVVALLVQVLREAEKVNPEKGKKEKWCVIVIPHVILWLRSQAEGRAWHGLSMPIAFGCCSNPDPTDDIKSRPTPQMLFNWYHLGVLEVDLQVDQGALSELRNRTADAGFLSLEIELGYRTISSAIENRDAGLFLKSLPRYVSLAEYFLRNRDNFRKEDPVNPTLRKIPAIEDDYWKTDERLCYVKQAILAFAACALVMGDSEAFREVATSLAVRSSTGLVPNFETNG
jgi:tetratricopeptide (TPR) repeat protein